MSFIPSAVLGDNIRRRRHDVGLSQEDLSTLAGLHPSTVSRLERGDGNPTMFVLLQLCVTLECTTADLLEGVEPGSLHGIAFPASAFFAARARTQKSPRPTTSGEVTSRGESG